MPTKDRLLVLLQTLQNNSDDERWLTTGDLRGALEKEGHECSIRTLRRDVQSLRNCGYEVVVGEREGTFNWFAYLGRKLFIPDLQILVSEHVKAKNSLGSVSMITCNRSRQR